MDKNRPFDLGKLDFEGIRRRRRKRLLLWSLPAIVVVFVIATKLVSLWGFTVLTTGFMAQRNYAAAGVAADWLMPANIIQPYVAFYNKANTLYMQGDYASAITAYKYALSEVPSDKECVVRLNLVLALEALGDTFAQDKKYDNAVVSYTEAKAVMRDGTVACGQPADKAPENPSDSEKMDMANASKSMKDAGERIDTKVAQAKLDRNGDKNTNNDSQTVQEADQPTAEQMETLQQLQTAAQRAYNDTNSFNRDVRESDSAYDYSIKRW